METKREYIVKCWYCGAEYNAFEAPLCQHRNPTKVCPYCLHCICGAPEAYKADFMGKCPKELLDDMSIQKGAENPKLGEMLVRSGKITREQLREAIERQSILKKKLGEILVMMGLLTPDELRLYLVDQKWTDEIDLHDFKLDMGLMERVGKDFCWRQRMIPIEYYRIGSDKILSFAVGSKDDLTQIRQSERLRDLVLIPYIAPREQVEKLLEEIRRDIEGDNIFNLDDDDDINI